MTSTFDQTDLGVHLRHSGNRIDGAQTLGSYTVVNFTLSQSVKRGLTVRFKLENAFDEKYQLAYGFNTPRRGAYMALEYRE
jgi:vitamin B12 transporter